MARDLWSPPPYYPVEESSFGAQPDGQCGYCFDVLEEDALNEKCCVQVLRILINQADSDINELEQDLVLLQSELAWIEDKEWLKRCSRTLKEKINCINGSIRRLRDKGEVHLLMNQQPVERLHVLLKALLASHLHEDDAQEQSEDGKDTIVKSLHLDVSENATKELENGKKRGNCHLDTVVHDLIEESCATKEDGADFKTSSKFQETKISNPKRIKSANTVGKDARLNASSKGNQRKKSRNSDLKITGNEKVTKEQIFTQGKATNSIPSLKPARRSHPRTDEPADSIVKKKIEMPLRCAKDQNEKHQSDSRLNTSKQSNNADMGQKLCDFVSVAARNRVSKKFKITSSSKEMNKLQQAMEVREAELDKIKNCTLNSLFELQERGLISRVQMGSSDCNADDLIRDLPLNESFLVGNSKAESLASLPSALTNLEFLKLADLRHIAKQRKMVRYSKLTKKALLELLAD